MRPAIFVLASIFSLSHVTATAEETQAPPVRPDYQIGPGDLISYSVLGIDDFSAVTRVSNSGRIHAPHLGILTVAGTSPVELARRLESDLMRRGLVRTPHVQVSVEEVRARPVYILGEVMNPGQFVITDRMSVADLISLSQGFNEVASPVGYLYRRKDVGALQSELTGSGESNETPEPVVDEAIQIVFDELYTDGEVNIELQGGDVLYVPERTRKYFYVVGDVYGPGAIEMPVEDPVFATRAIGMANGPMKTAKLKDSVVVTRLEDGSLSYENVDLKKILKGEVDDFIVRPGQIIFVPGSITKTVGQGMLNAVPGMVLLQ